MDIIGIAEGYVPSAADLYYRGSNPAGFVSKCSGNASCSLESGMIKLYAPPIGLGGSTLAIESTQAYDMSRYNYLNIELNFHEGSNAAYDLIATVCGIDFTINRAMPSDATVTVSYNIGSVYATGKVKFRPVTIGCNVFIYRIWFS